METVGIWIAALLTLCIFSFLFKENPLYRFAEHLFVGVSAGYWFVCYAWDILWAKLFLPLSAGEDLGLILALVLGLMMLGKLTNRLQWLGRWPVAFVVGCTVGFAIVSRLEADIMAQCRAMFEPFAGNSSAVYQSMAGYTERRGQDPKLGVTLPQMQAFAEHGVSATLPKNRDGQAGWSRREWQKFNGIGISLFARIDKDRDGLLSPRELDRFQEKFPNDYPPQFDRTAWDWDNDGQYSLIECESFDGGQPAFFELLDSNHNDVVAPTELDFFTTEIQPHFPVEVAATFAALDRNRDGLLTADEWRTPVLWTARVINGLVVLIGVITGLSYFFFTKEHKGALGYSAKIGIYILMISFGASFGYTVMSRISLLIGQMIFLMRDWLGLIQ